MARPMSDNARLDFCRRLAADAGRLAHSTFGRAALLPAKGRHDEVTAIDREVERVVRERIGQAFQTQIAHVRDGVRTAHALLESP